MIETHGILRLLHEYLGQPDDVRIVVKLLCQINHPIGNILLIAVLARREEGRESAPRNGVALIIIVGVSLQMCKSISVMMQGRSECATQILYLLPCIVCNCLIDGLFHGNCGSRCCEQCHQDTELES